MARRTTKRDEILAEMGQELERAKLEALKLESEHEDVQTRRLVAQAVVTALTKSYAKLERSLAPKPRQQPAATKGASKKRASGGKKKSESELPLTCAYVFPDDGRAYAGQTCTAEKANVIHYKEYGYAGYHPFVPPARPARTQSPPNGAGGSSTANIEDETASALIAAETGV